MTSPQTLARSLRPGVGWTPLKTGSVIDLVAPGSACGIAELHAAAKTLQTMGFVPRYSRDLFQGKSPILSAPDAHRLQQLKRALLTQDSDAVWCLRGGYGSLRLLPELSRLKPPRRAKLFIGYSDITSLHIFLKERWHWATLHAPVLERLGRGQMSLRENKALFSLICGSKKTITYRLRAMNAAARRPRSINSEVVGGNATVLQSHLGTDFQLSTRDRILFLEDIFEKPHRVDRTLTHYQQSGFLKGCRAIVFGDFILDDKKLLNLLWKKVLNPFAEAQRIPVLKGLPCGHGSVQMPLPLGTPTELSLGDLPRMTLQSGTIA